MQYQKLPIGNVWDHDGPGTLRYKDLKEDDEKHETIDLRRPQYAPSGFCIA